MFNSWIQKLFCIYICIKNVIKCTWDMFCTSYSSTLSFLDICVLLLLRLAYFWTFCSYFIWFLLNWFSTWKKGLLGAHPERRLNVDQGIKGLLGADADSRRQNDGEDAAGCRPVWLLGDVPGEPGHEPRGEDWHQVELWPAEMQTFKCFFWLSQPRENKENLSSFSVVVQEPGPGDVRPRLWKLYGKCCCCFASVVIFMILTPQTLIHPSIHLSDLHYFFEDRWSEQRFLSPLKSYHPCRNTPTRLTSWCLWAAGGGSAVRSPTEETSMTPWGSE